ncbi:hypothetical protein THASP1DRAFT_25212, partial [Thamnocephalis sphaerospora]
MNFSIRTLAVAAAAVALWPCSLSNATPPLLSMATLASMKPYGATISAPSVPAKQIVFDPKAKNRLGIPNLFIEQENPAGEGNAYTAFVQYEQQPGFLKCTGDPNQFYAEYQALSAIQSNSPRQYGLPSAAKRSFVRMLAYGNPKKGIYCTVFERLNGVNLKAYARALTPKQKDNLLPRIFSQFII